MYMKKTNGKGEKICKYVKTFYEAEILLRTHEGKNV
jgi:hypothetical protein